MEVRAGCVVVIGLACVMADDPPYTGRWRMVPDKDTGKRYEVLRVYEKHGVRLAVLVPPGLVGADESDADFDDFPVRRLKVTE